MNPTCENHDTGVDAVAVAVVLYHWQSAALGTGICESCGTCSDPTCGELGIVFEPEYGEPWCAPHARSWGGADGPIIGADIVPIDSDRYRALIAEQNGPTR